jgi:hypothetical protein
VALSLHLAVRISATRFDGNTGQIFRLSGTTICGKPCDDRALYYATDYFIIIIIIIIIAVIVIKITINTVLRIASASLNMDCVYAKFVRYNLTVSISATVDL